MQMIWLSHPRTLVGAYLPVYTVGVSNVNPTTAQDHALHSTLDEVYVYPLCPHQKG